MLAQNIDFNEKEEEILTLYSEITEELVSRKSRLIQLAAKAMNDNRKTLFLSLIRDKDDIDKDLSDFKNMIKNVREAVLQKDKNYQNYIRVITTESERMNKLRGTEVIY